MTIGDKLAGAVNLAVPTARYSRQSAPFLRQRLLIAAAQMAEAIEKAGGGV